ncbi:MAG: TetR family transcriptional regulator C-terminal domain-containing protein [Actinobacteria bacterium]|nr:TetR family transcriptional regulator C-terminal domain-containing protein [Actinomycetota bacterium]
MKKPTVEERRTEILEVTCEVVIERGFAATRIADVAKRLGVSSSLIHYHFDSKEQLLAEAFAHYARKDVAEMEAEIQAAPTAVAQLDRLVHNYVPEGSGDVEWMLWIDGWGEALRNPMMRKISQELDEQSAALAERVIRHGITTGEFACGDPAAAAMRVAAVVDGLAVQFAAHDGMMTREQFIEHVRTLAAWEVGLEPEALRDGAAGTPPSGAAPTPATDTALRQLVSKWCDALIRADSDAFISCWADDGTWESPKPVTGREALLAHFAKVTASYNWLVQTAPNAVFEVDESLGTGTGRVTIVESFKSKKTGAGSLFAVYHDRYHRVGGAWVFTERRLEVLHRG